MRVPLCKVAEIPDEGARTVSFFGREVLVMKVDGNPRAILNICMHLGGPMSREGTRLICQWHGAEFDCGGGRRLAGPAAPEARLITLPTRVEEGMLTYVYGE